MLEEVPEAYKDIDATVDIVHNAGLARKVGRLRPPGCQRLASNGCHPEPARAFCERSSSLPL